MSIWKQESLKQQIYSQLLREIISEEIAPGMPLPSAALLAKRFNAGRETIKQVIAQLAEANYIIRRNRRVPLAAKKLPVKHYTIAIPFIEYPGHMLQLFDYQHTPWTWLLYRATAEALLKRGHNAVLLNYTIDKILNNNVDGVITIASTRNRNWAKISNLPVISVMDGDYGASGTVNIDRSQSMLQIATYFLANGVKTVLLMSFNKNYRSSYRYFVQKFLLETLKDNGFTDSNIVDYDYTSDTSFETGAAMMQDFMQLDLPKPWGIITPGDFMAQGAVKVGLQANLQCKKDFFVIGGTGLKEVENWTPPLSTAGTSFEELGEKAVDAIIEFITTGVKPSAVSVKNKLIIRDT